MVIFVLFLIVGIMLTLFICHRPFRFVPLWGVLWGSVFGFWFLVPLMLEVHHMPSLSVQQWSIVDALFFAVFASVGAVATTLVTLPIAVFSVLRKRVFRNTAWAYSAWSAVSLPVAYLSLSILVEWTNFARPPSVDAYGSMITWFVAGYVALVGILLVAYRRIAAEGWDPHGRRLGIGLVAITILGCLAVPLRVDNPAGLPSPARPLTRRSSTRPAPLLIIGLDGGNWRTLKPLIGRGTTPTFSRLAAEGVQGKVDALWPPFWSTPAWGAILTGYSQDEVGVYEDLSATAAGFPRFELPLTLNLALNPLFAVEFVLIGLNAIEVMPTPRGGLNRAPVWERLSRAAVKTAVVRFPFTYPATGQADYVISNRLVVDLWDRLGVKPGEREHLITPNTKADELWADVFTESDAGLLLNDVLSRPDWPKPHDALEDPVAVLKTVAEIDTRMNHAAIELLRRDRDVSVLMLHVTGFDSVCHAFWQYRFPEDFPNNPPRQADIDHLGPVVDRYLERIDRQLAALIAAFPSPPNVLIVSDHGAGPSHSYPLWRGWHDSPGLFLAAGPDIPHISGMLEVSYYDIVPTILQLQGFEPDADLRGRSAIDESRLMRQPAPLNKTGQ